MVCSVGIPTTAFLFRNYVTQWVAKRSEKDAHCEKLNKYNVYLQFYTKPYDYLSQTVYMYKKT